MINKEKKMNRIKKIITKNQKVIILFLIGIIMILLLLAGIATLGGENGIFAKVKLAKKAQLEAEMKEQLTRGLQELQIEKKANATLDDVTQDWANSAISSEYNPIVKEDASLNGKLIVMTKDNIIGKFLIDQNLNIEKIEYNTSSLEFEYTTISRIDNRVKINIVITDKINGIKQIDYPEENSLKVVNGKKEKISIDYEVELGKEYKFIITTGDENTTEKIIKIDDYFYNITKDLGEAANINNNATKAAYNKTYEATISTEGNYAITSLVVTMGGQTITTSDNDIVDINTGKIKIEKVTGDINIKATTKKLEITYTIGINASGNASDTSSLGASSVSKPNTLYINIIATLLGNSCKVVSKTDNSKGVPYAVTSNGKYTFIVSGTYNGKTISEEKEVTVNQYKSAQNIVKYDAGEWTKEEIEELQSQNLYMINKEKTYNATFNLNDSNNGLNFTFGGFTYKGDTTNESDISSGKIITSRNQSVKPQKYFGTPKYYGWQLLTTETKQDESGNKIKNEDGSDRIYVTKITHAGSPENFAYKWTVDYDNRRVVYLLSGGKKQMGYSTLSNGTAIKPRSFQMYVDNSQKDLIADTTDKDGNAIKDIHAMDYDEAYAITNDIYNNGGMRNIGSQYWLVTAYGYDSYRVWAVKNERWHVLLQRQLFWNSPSSFSNIWSLY